MVYHWLVRALTISSTWKQMPSNNSHAISRYMMLGHEPARNLILGLLHVDSIVLPGKSRNLSTLKTESFTTFAMLSLGRRRRRKSNCV